MQLSEILDAKVHQKVHFFEMKKNYSIGFYTGGLDPDKWMEYPKEMREQALKKHWYLRWSFRKDNLLIRQPNIKGSTNGFKTKSERMMYLKALKQELIELLETGWSPYKQNPLQAKKQNITIEDAIDFVMKLWEKTVSPSTLQDYKSRINMFYKWIGKNGFARMYVHTLTKKVVLTYLNEVLHRSSPKNRNNQRACLSSFFSTLEANEYIETNPCDKIPQLKVKPKRNKTYTQKQEQKIFDYLQQSDPLLLLYLKFISYNFLRPIEVARLQIKNIDFDQKRLTVQTKTDTAKTKIIPDILFQEIKHMEVFPAEYFLFSPNGPGFWETSEVNRRDYWSKRFKKVKEHFKLDEDYGIYSFRHTFITKLYRELRKEYSPFEVKSRLMLITGHTTLTALEKYLRDIDAELPEDYSHLLK